MVTDKHRADVATIQRQGGDPMVYLSGLAGAWRVSLKEAKSIVESIGGSARRVDAETVARERLRVDLAARSSSAYRRWNHEEE